jgi:hypothetical protein
MNENPTPARWLLDGRSQLLLLREETWLNTAGIATVDRAIAALDALLAEPADHPLVAAALDQNRAC